MIEIAAARRPPSHQSIAARALGHGPAVDGDGVRRDRLERGDEPCLDVAPVDVLMSLAVEQRDVLEAVAAVDGIPLVKRIASRNLDAVDFGAMGRSDADGSAEAGDVIRPEPGPDYGDFHAATKLKGCFVELPALRTLA